VLFPELRLYPSSQLYPGMPLPRTPTTAVFGPGTSAGVPDIDDSLAGLIALLAQAAPAPDDSEGLPETDASRGSVTSLTTRTDPSLLTSEASIIG
jgi:hypothetical protein